jgi:hypothetical protein
MKILKLNPQISALQIGDLEDLAVGDAIELHGINQGLPEECYDLQNWRFIKDYEKETHSKFRVTLPTDGHGRRYIRIKKISGLF